MPGFFHNLCPRFNIVFAQLGVISRTKSRFVKIVAVEERYLITTHVKNEESKMQPFRICLPLQLVDGRMLIKKAKKFSYLFKKLSVWTRWLEK